MVYLVRSQDSTDVYDSWLCGGALVTPSQILTSAACIVDIDNIYAIAGYRHYVNGMDIERDNCTRLKKRKIVKIRVPREHVTVVDDYSNTTRWMTLDIGVATVDQPYDFDDITFKVYCSYIPAAIQINYDISVDNKIGTSVVALGWGRDRGSKAHDLVDRNSETLREVSIKIQNKEDCITQFKGNGLSEMIDKYMICTHGRGLLDGEGYVIEEVDRKHNNKCIKYPDGKDDCFEEDYDDISFAIRRNSGKFIPSRNNIIRTNRAPPSDQYNGTNNTERASEGTRRQGICQNDHGGPLVTWVGTTELLIGVAVNSLYDEQFNCIGPYIFTSTAAAGQILKCLLTHEHKTRKSCSAAANQGYDIFENVATTYDASGVSAMIKSDSGYPRTLLTLEETRNNVQKTSSKNIDSNLNSSSIEVVTL